MPAPDKSLALSAVEAEALRDMRARLNRRAVSDAALLTLGVAFTQVCARVGLSGAEPLPAERLSGPAVVKAAAAAAMPTLARLVATLAENRKSRPADWPALVAAGAPQAVLSRRLALAGREPTVDTTAP